MHARNRLHILTWPFHNGLRDVSMGSGPIRLATDDEFRAGIEAEGWTVTSEEIEAVDESDPEIVRVIELIRRLAGGVAEAVSEGAFPLVLAGNCNSALGTTAGIGAENLGVVWCDANPDFDDPGEHESGLFDVMGLAMLTGRGWRALRQTIPGHVPIREPNGILAEVRLDIHEAQANKYAAPGGPSLTRLLDCIRLVGERQTVVGAAITAYDPAFDPDDHAMSAARAVAREIAKGARPQPTSGTG
jgi:arginase